MKIASVIAVAMVMVFLVLWLRCRLSIVRVYFDKGYVFRKVSLKCLCINELVCVGGVFHSLRV